LFETKKDFSGEGRIFYDYLIENGYNKNYEIIWLVRNPEKLKNYKTKNVRLYRVIRSMIRNAVMLHLTDICSVHAIFFMISL